MTTLDSFREIVSAGEPIGRRTCMRVGGPAQWLARPRSPDELARLIRQCADAGIPCRLFGGGSNILVPDEGVKGVVLSLTGPEFDFVRLDGARATAGAGAELAQLIAETSRASFSGLEFLVGIPGSVGGAVQRNAGNRTGDISQSVRALDVMDPAGEIHTKSRGEIRFDYRRANLDDAIILAASFDLVADDPKAIVERIKRVWIAKKASQPFGFQSAGYVFRDSRGHAASDLIDEAGLRGATKGAVEVCTRDPRFLIAHEGASASDVRRLIDLVRTNVEAKTGVTLELQIDIW